MILNKLKLINFRNYKKQNIRLNDSINIFIGNNAEGKTNILEAIYVLALSKSYRTNNDNNLINNASDSFKIVGEVKKDKYYKTLSLEISNCKKKTCINDTYIRKISDYVTNLNVILFSPEDVETIKGSPSLRRELINIEISQISQKYINFYNEYNKILKMRNDYLKMIYINGISDYRYLDVLTDNLIERSAYIYSERKQFLDKINNEIGIIYEKIAGKNSLNIKYITNIEINNFEISNLKKVLKDKYVSNRRKELVAGMTLYGPHRDDFQFLLDDKDIKLFGSQGQQKIAMIAFKLAEINIFNEVTQTLPILLLDDIFSELDRKKRNNLISFINSGIQVVITSNDTVGISKKILENSKIFKIENGKIVEKGDYNGKRKK